MDNLQQEIDKEMEKFYKQEHKQFIPILKNLLKTYFKDKELRVLIRSKIDLLSEEI